MGDLKSLFNSAKAKLKGKKPGDKATDQKEHEYAELLAVWPNGTWTFDKTPEMDLVVRGVLLDIWWLEAFVKAEEMAGRKLNPGMFGDRPDPIPKGWKPSKRIMDHYATRNKVADDKWKHVVDKLTAAKNLKP